MSATLLSIAKRIGIWLIPLCGGITFAFGQKQVVPVPTSVLPPVLEVAFVLGIGLLVWRFAEPGNNLWKEVAALTCIGFIAGYFIPLL